MVKVVVLDDPLVFLEMREILDEACLMPQVWRASQSSESLYDPNGS